MKKKTILALVLSLSLLVSGTLSVLQNREVKAADNNVWSGHMDSSWYRDTSATEYTIRTAEELAGLANLVNSGDTLEGKTVYLESDIVLNEGDAATWGTTAPKNSWTPIGNNTNFFQGTFDGRGHTISGMYIKNTTDTANQQGLFGVVAQKKGDVAAPAIRNVSVVNAYIDNQASAKSAMLVGQIYAAGDFTTEIRVENIYVQGTIAASYSKDSTKHTARAAGICSELNLNTKTSSTAVFRNVVSNVNISSDYTSHLAGILASENTQWDDKNASKQFPGTKVILENCVNLGNLLSDYTGCTTGGLVGAMSTGGGESAVTVTNCVNAGNVKGQMVAAGVANLGHATRTSTFTINGYINIGEVLPLDTTYSKGAAGAIYASTLKKGVTGTFKNCYSIKVNNLDSAKEYAKDVLTADSVLTTLSSDGFDVTGWTAVAGVAPMPTVTAVLSGYAAYDANRLAAVQNTEPKDGLMTVRLIGSIASLDYKQVGFTVTVNDSGVTGVDTSTVSKQIAYEEDGTAKKLDSCTAFLAPYVYFEELKNISTEGTVTIKVTPYKMDKKGNKTVGEEYTVVYEQGVLKKVDSATGGLTVKDDTASGYNKPQGIN